MAQKAAKQTAHRNTSTLNRTHLIAAVVHIVFIAQRVVLRRLTGKSVAVYLTLCAPSLLFEFWLERVGRPSYVPGTKELRRSGEDLDAKGLTEYMWDVIYWTWGCTVFAAVLGDWGWWFWAAVPVYSVWLAYTTYTGIRSGTGLFGNGGSGADHVPSTSNRQKKMEKRGGQRVQYR